MLEAAKKSRHVNLHQAQKLDAESAVFLIFDMGQTITQIRGQISRENWVAARAGVDNLVSILTTLEDRELIPSIPQEADRNIDKLMDAINDRVQSTSEKNLRRIERDIKDLTLEEIGENITVNI